MCLLAFLRRVFIGSVPPNPESFLRVRRTGSAPRNRRTSVLGSPAVSASSGAFPQHQLGWPRCEAPAVSEDSVMSLDPSGTHEYRRSCGRPCERPPQAAEQRRTADRDAQKVIVPIFVRIDMGRASPLSAVDAQDVRAAEHIRARHTGRLALRFYSCEMRVARS